MTLPKWLDAEVFPENGRWVIKVTKIKWWGWPFVLAYLVRQIAREAIQGREG